MAAPQRSTQKIISISAVYRPTVYKHKIGYPKPIFKGMDNRFFSYVMLCVSLNLNLHYLKSQKNLSFANSLIMISGLQQFKSQEPILDRLYRYNYFWNFSNDKINMPNVFYNFFNGLSYEHFKNLGALIFFYAALKKGDTSQIINYLNFKYKPVVNALTISRNKYKEEQSKKLDDNFENAIYGFNYLHPYPYIECQGLVFLPLPYLIIDAITDSLLTRITFDNNALRETIGKEVAQSYTLALTPSKAIGINLIEHR